jgi:benzodiazapine receptor
MLETRVVQRRGRRPGGFARYCGAFTIGRRRWLGRGSPNRSNAATREGSPEVGTLERGMSFATKRRMRTSIASGLAFAVIGGATVLSALVGARATQRGKPWYRLLRKSKLNPPDAAFGPVWTALYALNGVSAARVYRSEPSRARTRTLALWGIQQALNAAWTPLFFGQRRPLAALADIGLLWTSIGAYLLEARKVDRTAAALVAPYLAWVSFAAFLNEEVVRKNPKLLSAG